MVFEPRILQLLRVNIRAYYIRVCYIIGYYTILWYSVVYQYDAKNLRRNPNAIGERPGNSVVGLIG